jgi:4-amino-4-deoxy-L-arabinose transferase-like glycosyltransferase
MIGVNLPNDPLARSNRITLLLLAGVLLVGLALRLGGAFHDLPFSYYGDEMQFVKRSMALGSGDLNPHWFNKPALLMYTLAFSYGLYFVAGYILGSFASVEQFGAHFLQDMGPFLLIGRLVVVAFGVATIYVVYRIADMVFRSRVHGLCAALAAAVMLPMVAGAQVVKADVPAAFFVCLSFYWYLRSIERNRFLPLAVAALVAGVAMGTKYYGIMLLPGYVIAELLRFVRREATWKQAVLRSAAVGALFGFGFLMVSPFNVIDPTWRYMIFAAVKAKLGMGSGGPLFAADSGISYQPGLGAVARGARHLLGALVDGSALGIVFSTLGALGWVACAWYRRTRAFAAHVAAPLAIFALLGASWQPFHAAWRHFAPVYPLVCLLILPGAMGASRIFGVRGRRFVALAAAVVTLAVGVALVRSVRHDKFVMRPDTRTLAYHWVVESIPPDDRILLDENGPILQPNVATIRRERKRLLRLSQDGAFTYHQGLRLDLLERFPGKDARNFEELAHPWWWDRELTAEELRGVAVHRRMGNPMKIRLPIPLDAYHAAGYRFVITNSYAQSRYFVSAQAEQSFPSFVRFYRELHQLQPVHTFDPVTLGCKGPVIWVYELPVGESLEAG